MGGRLAREAQDRQRAPRGQGGQPLTLRLNDLLGVAEVDKDGHQVDNFHPGG